MSHEQPPYQPSISDASWRTPSQLHRISAINAAAESRYSPTPMITWNTSRSIRMRKRMGAGGRRIMTMTTIWFFSYPTLTTTMVGPKTGLMTPYRTSPLPRGMLASRHRELETLCLRPLMTTVEMGIPVTVAVPACHPSSHHCRLHIHRNVAAHFSGH